MIHGGSKKGSQDGTIYQRGSRVHHGAQKQWENRTSLGEIRVEV